MTLLPRKGLLAITAVIDVAVNARGQPVSAKALAVRHGLPPRHLEPVLQALVHGGILKGIRGPRGGYELARERRRITVDEVVRAIALAEDDADTTVGSSLIGRVVSPAIVEAERAFSTALAQISMDELARRAETLDRVDGVRQPINFTI